jgi:hypothetical protein
VRPSVPFYKPPIDKKQPEIIVKPEVKPVKVEDNKVEEVKKVEPVNPDPLKIAASALQKKLEDIKEDVDEENKEATNDKLKPKEIISKIAESKAQSELRSLLDSLEMQLNKPPA